MYFFSFNLDDNPGRQSLTSHTTEEETEAQGCEVTGKITATKKWSQE